MSSYTLVAGATGGTGQQVVRKLLARARPVRILLRDIGQGQALFGDRVHMVIGDVRQPESLPAAFNNVEQIVCAVAARLPIEPGSTPQQIDFEGVRHLVDAARAAGVVHFVLVSSVGVTHPNHPMNRMYQDVLKWKLRGEDALRAGGLSYTILRPGGLSDDPGGKGIKFAQGDTISGRISRADVAEVCIHALDELAAQRVTVEFVESSSRPPSDWATVFGGLQKDPR